jgi:phosphoglycolate phosphatase
VTFPRGRPEAILFDWDSTLVDNWDSLARTMSLVLAESNRPPVARETMISLSKKPHDEIFAMLFESDAATSRLRFYELYSQEHLSGLKILSGSEELLAALFRLSIPLAVVSNKKGVLVRREIEHLGWSDYFFTIIGAGDAARDKPHPDPVLLALENRLIPPSLNVWMLGDTSADIGAAGEAGISPILIETTASLGMGLEGVFDTHKPVSRVKDADAFWELVQKAMAFA